MYSIKIRSFAVLSAVQKNDFSRTKSSKNYLYQVFLHYIATLIKIIFSEILLQLLVGQFLSQELTYFPLGNRMVYIISFFFPFIFSSIIPSSSKKTFIIIFLYYRTASKLLLYPLVLMFNCKRNMWLPLDLCELDACWKI